jgi:hypothetical protein
MREEDWPTTHEGIAALLARMDQVEPGWLSPEEDAAWRGALRGQKQFENGHGFLDHLLPRKRESTYESH